MTVQHGNGAPADSTGSVAVPVHEDLYWYDQLPPSLRETVRGAADLLYVKDVYDAWQRGGVTPAATPRDAADGGGTDAARARRSGMGGDVADHGSGRTTPRVATGRKGGRMTWLLALIGYVVAYAVAALVILGVLGITAFALLCAWLLHGIDADDAPTIDPFTHGSGTP